MQGILIGTNGRENGCNITSDAVHESECHFTHSKPETNTIFRKFSSLLTELTQHLHHRHCTQIVLFSIITSGYPGNYTKPVYTILCGKC
jgi:hypothetical protein